MTDLRSRIRAALTPYMVCPMDRFDQAVDDVMQAVERDAWFRMLQAGYTVEEIRACYAHWPSPRAHADEEC